MLFGISFSEIILILIVALIVFGPKQLPIIAHKIGNALYKGKIYLKMIKNDMGLQNDILAINNTTQEFFNTYHEIKNNIIPTNSSLKQDNDIPYKKEKLYQPEFNFEKQPELFDEY